jgi:hypothetical protein
VVGFPTFRSKPPRPHAGVPAVRAAAREGAAEALGESEVAADPAKIMPAINGSRNPFTAPPGAPPIPLASEKRPGSKGKAESDASDEARVMKPVVAPTVPTFVVASAPSTGVQPAGVAATPPPPAKPSLSGIVIDSAGKPTAVIHEGDQRYFAKAGDTVAGKYRVQSISNQQVVLVVGQERLTLKMGGS